MFIKKVGGVQDENGTNSLEAEAILIHIKEVIVQEEELPNEHCSSIGVLSPFRNQTDYLSEYFKTHLTFEDIKRHKIRLGTPYHFQGEERDIMLLSMALDNNSHPAGFKYLNKEDVFNVAITRA